jgi:outer membrane protein assembly factor BamB
MHDTFLCGVIALPVLLPIAALLQLLFPGLLRDQWRQYQIAVYTLLTQSTLIFLHFVAVTWIFTTRPVWLSDNALSAALVAVAAFGLLRAIFARPASAPAAPPTGNPPTKPAPPATNRPHRVEYLALGGLGLAGLAWAGYLALSGASPWDQMAVVTAAAAMGLAHVLLRQMTSPTPTPAVASSPAPASPARPLVRTELVFLATLASAGAALGYYQGVEQANVAAAPVVSEWPAFRGSELRTGAVDPRDAGPQKPVVLWTFDPGEKKGRIYIHSSPTVVDGQVYVGAMHEVSATVQGYLYCINAADGRQAGGQPRALGERLWRYTADRSMKPVYSSPTIAGGKVYIGEGYHEDQGCRLFCLDARGGADAGYLWARTTQSHVESSPWVQGSRVYFGAGDDGILCVDGSQLEEQPGGAKSPKLIWQVPKLHVDASPIVVGNRLFAGSVIGDLFQETQVLCVNTDDGGVVWRVATPLPVTCPAYADGRVFFGLASGKVSDDGKRPGGAVWCLAAESGEKLWEMPAAASVLGSPALAEKRVYFGSRDKHARCATQDKGAPVWKRELSGPIVASPVVAGGKAYFVTVAGTVHCLNAATGEPIWEQACPAPDEDVYSSPTLADGRLYVASGGKVYCLGDAK